VRKRTKGETMSKQHIISKEKHRVFLDISFFKKKKGIPNRTLCGLESIDFGKGDGIATPDKCNCELCLQVEDNIQKHWSEI